MIDSQATKIKSGSRRDLTSHVWTGLKETYPTEHSMIVFLHIISRLDDDYRQYGAKLILE
jgi:hypothetical protein